MIIYIGSDHNGFHLKRKLVTYLNKAGYNVSDEGPERLDPDDDFPVFAAKVVKDVLSSSDHDARGILICGSGQGMAMAANRHKGIRAALGYDRESARSSRNDDDANVLALPASVFNADPQELAVIVETFLTTPFAKAARFTRRIREMDNL